jgi:hypothetical protein
MPPVWLISATAAFSPPCVSGIGLLAPVNAVDSITWIGLPVAVLLLLVLLLLLLVLLELELQPVNTRHAAAAATGATNLSFIRPPMGADGDCDVHYLTAP